MNDFAQYLPVLKSTSLFKGATDAQILQMLNCLGAHTVEYCKGEYIFSSGDVIHDMGLVLKGCVIIERGDYLGNRNIVTEASAGELFGEIYACSIDKRTTVSAIANSDCTVLFLNAAHIAAPCPSVCSFHLRLTQNLISIIADFAYMLDRKEEHTSQRTTREKLMSYLSEQAENFSANEFDIPLNRQELADYLYVDRSAMSSELSKMQKEGLIEYNRNHFIICRK